MSDALSIVVPVYNSEASLPLLVERLQQALTPTGRAFELVLVNDCSRDRSWEVVAELAARHDWVRGLDLMRNYGQHSALLCGIRDARHPVVVTIDDDLQNPPEEIQKLLARLDEGVDVVYGVPEREQHGLWRDVASKITKMALRSAMDTPIAPETSAFRAFRRDLRNAFGNYQGPFVSIDVLLTWGTTRFASVVVRHDARAQGVSNYTFRKLVTHALTMMTGFSTAPLRLASVMALVLMLFGLVVLAYVLGRYALQGSSVPGFPFLASVIAIFSGTQLFALGIIGEYLARMHFRILDRPSYTVRRTASRPA